MTCKCPGCGGPVAQLIVPESKTRLGPVATIACVGIDGPSCGWFLGLWLEMAAITEVAELMEMEEVTV